MRPTRCLPVLWLVGTFAALASLLVSPANAAVPAGFTDELVDNINQAISLAFLPDGRMLIGECDDIRSTEREIDLSEQELPVAGLNRQPLSFNHRYRLASYGLFLLLTPMPAFCCVMCLTPRLAPLHAKPPTKSVARAR